MLFLLKREMPGFKPKTNKKIKFNKQKSITLDGKHKEFLNEFSKDDNDRIPDLKAEKKELEIKLENPDEKLTVEQQLDITDRIKEIKNTIKELKAKKKEYFLDNSKLSRFYLRSLIIKYIFQTCFFQTCNYQHQATGVF